MVCVDVVSVSFFKKPSVFVKLGEAALHYAAWNGFEEIVNILLEHGANVDLQDKVLIFSFCFFFFLIFDILILIF